MQTKKVLVAVSLEEETHDALAQVGQIGLSEETEIHLVHIVPIILYARGIHPQALTYPLPEERPKIEMAILNKLAVLKQELLPRHKNVVTKCLFDADEKIAFSQYAIDIDADLMLVASRKKHGVLALFDSSFAQYQLKHAKMNLIILR